MGCIENIGQCTHKLQKKCSCCAPCCWTLFCCVGALGLIIAGVFFIAVANTFNEETCVVLSADATNCGSGESSYDYIIAVEGCDITEHLYAEEQGCTDSGADWEVGEELDCLSKDECGDTIYIGSVDSVEQSGISMLVPGIIMVLFGILFCWMDSYGARTMERKFCMCC